jgi:hypothetical protein
MKRIAPLVALALLAASPAAAQFGPKGGGGGGGSGPPGPPGPTLNGPGYAPGAWYLPPGEVGRSATATAVASITTAYCTVAWFGNISPTGGSGKLGNIGFAALTAGTTAVEAAIYDNDTSVTPNRPGALLGASSADRQTIAMRAARSARAPTFTSA